MYQVISLTLSHGFAINAVRDFKDARALATQSCTRPGNHVAIYDHDGAKIWSYTAPMLPTIALPSGWLVQDGNQAGNTVTGYIYGEGDRDRAIEAAKRMARDNQRSFFVRDRFGFIECEAHP